VGLIFGRAGEHEYSDAVVTAPETLLLRSKVDAIVDENMDEAAADVTVETTTGERHHIFVEHAIGSLENPMTNDQLKAKFIDQASAVVGSTEATRLWIWAMSRAA